MLAHGGEGEHAAIVRVDAPALSGNVAAPDETDVAAIGWRGAEPSDHRLAFDADMREVAKPDAVEDLLPGRQVLQQHFRGEVAFGQRRDRRQGPCVGKGFRRGDLDQHLRGAVGARPHHAAIGADIAGLHAGGHDRPVGGAAEIRHRERADRAGASGGEKTTSRKAARNPARNPERHAEPPSIRRENAMPAPPELERIDDGSITGFADQALPAARNCALARCRFCGMLINSALRSATALWNCSIAMLNAVNVPSSIAPCSKHCSVSRRMASASGLHLVEFVHRIALARRA